MHDAKLRCSDDSQAQWVVQGRYSFKLLAVDVPTAAGAEQRLFIEGNDQLYTRGGVMSELRDPFLRVGCSKLDRTITNMAHHAKQC